MKRSRFSSARRALVFWCLFIGLGALLGGSCMLIRPDGSILQMQGMLPYFQVLPFAEILFQDFLFSGIALLAVNGFSNLTAAVLLLRKKHAGAVLGTMFGITLMLWICIQFIIFPMNVMSTAYFIFGLIQTATGSAALVFEKQERFHTDTANYPRIGTDPRTLVVFFSRMGYTKRIALETAEETGGILCELHAKERTEGTAGFWWCGRYAMHGWDMPIETPEYDPAGFEHVIIVSPVWVFRIAPPVHSYLKWARGRIRSVSYILIHHMNAAFASQIQAADELLGVKNKEWHSIRCRCGTFRKIR